MENRCEFCGKKTLSLRRCSVCQQVYYCSTVCQKEDWKRQHKVKCKVIQKLKQTKDAKTSADFCNIPKTGNILYPPEGVSNATFMEFMKQKESFVHEFCDLRSGNSLVFHDKLDKNGNSKGTGGTRCKKCVVCGDVSEAVKTCTRCKKADYCCKKCQRKDWKTHKLQCKDPEGNVYQTKPTDSCSGKGTFASESAKSTDSGASNPLPEVPNLCQRSFVKPGALDTVKSLTLKAFPGCTILDLIREIPHEPFGMRPRGSFRVAVGFISRYHRYVLRHCIFLQDKDGTEVYVAFYLHRDEPRPYFRWTDIVPGRYLCIADPYIHQFLDGSVGIRVDDPSTVRTFSV